MDWTTGVQFLPGSMMGVFLFATAPTPALRPTQHPFHWAAWALTPVVKRTGREAGHL